MNITSLSVQDGMELAVIMVATFGQALCAPATAINVIGILIFWRFVVCLRIVIFDPVHSFFRILQMGIGIGGDYPISAVISSEFSSVYIRGRVMAAVFANQGWGQLCMFSACRNMVDDSHNLRSSRYALFIHHCLCIQTLLPT